MTEKLATARNVTIDLAAQLTGLSAHGIRGKIKRGQWACGIHYHKAPDGRIYINLAAVDRWVEKGV